MKNFPLLFLLSICVAQSHAQTTSSYGRIVVEITKEKRFVSSQVQEVSAIPGADSSWIHWLEENINHAVRLQKRPKKGKYSVTVTYVIDKHGNIADIRCTNDPGFGMGETVVRLLKKSPRWEPGPHPVRPYRTSAVKNKTYQ